LGKILNNVKKWQIPRFINTDKAPAYGRALALLKREGRKRAARTVLTGMCYSVGSATRQGEQFADPVYRPVGYD
ncbi:hypothetical protein WDK59_25595, partial [Escherichia coli]